MHTQVVHCACSLIKSPNPYTQYCMSHDSVLSVRQWSPQTAAQWSINRPHRAVKHLPLMGSQISEHSLQLKVSETMSLCCYHSSVASHIIAGIPIHLIPLSFKVVTVATLYLTLYSDTIYYCHMT